MRVIKAVHLTAHDRKLINTSIANNLQDVSSPKKRLNIICTDEQGNVKANLWSYEVGIGWGAKSRWVMSEIIFKP